ncbi:hypothetical protein MYX77_12245, partial [Acidobacteriia bacterium AH_259_A11_L15]|nr:hypothetical protein [Acidobacteriia bacterium AH_259_A11_L15]
REDLVREKQKRREIDEQMAVLEAQLRREVETRLARGESVTEEELTSIVPMADNPPPADLHAAAGDD